MSPAARRCAVAFLLLLWAGAVACGNSLKQHEERAIDAWLSCDECRSGEREAVRSLGERALDRLESALRNGPPDERRAIMRQKFQTTYAIAVGGSPGTSTITAPAYVARAMDGYIRTYQTRAALSLADIGPRGQVVLRSIGTGAALRPDVLDAIGVASGSTDTARFRGALLPAAAAYGDTVVVRPPPFELFDGNELVAVDTSTCDSSDPPLSVEPDRLRFLVAGDAGVRRVWICNVGSTTRRQWTKIALRTVYDANDRRLATCPNYPCRLNNAPRLIPGVTPASPFRAKLSLWSGAGIVDTLDMFRFEPSAATTVTARLEWNTQANLDLRWITCGGVDVGNTDGATTARPEQTVQLIPAGACWLLLVHLKSTSTEMVHARLRVSTS
jgi:hypothetical protein